MPEAMTPLPQRKPIPEGVSPEVAALLSHIFDVSSEMKRLQKALEDAGEERRQTVTRLRAHGVTWKMMAEHACVSDAALFKHMAKS